MLSNLRVSQYFAVERDHAILKKYSDSCYKVILMKSCRLPGFEEVCEDIKGKRNSAGHSHKLDASLSRTRSRIFEIAMCNDWTYFATITLSPENGNRHDLKTFQRRLSKWLNNLNSRNGWNIKYLLIPEPHKDGSWHMHGLFMGIPDCVLSPFSSYDHLPYILLGELKKGKRIFNWPECASRFGFVTFEKICNMEACAKYITKYITKELAESNSRLNEKLYLCSHGLKRAKTVFRGRLSRSFEPDFSNDFVAVKTFRSFDEAVALFESDSNIFDLSPSFYVGFMDVVGSAGGDTTWKLCPQI